MNKEVDTNDNENKSAINSLANFTKKNQKKVFIFDLIMGLAVTGIGLYFDITWLALVGVAGLVIGIFNPNKYFIKMMDKKKQEKI